MRPVYMVDTGSRRLYTVDNNDYRGQLPLPNPFGTTGPHWVSVLHGGVLDTWWTSTSDARLYTVEHDGDRGSYCPTQSFTGHWTFPARVWLSGHGSTWHGYLPLT